MYKYLVSIIRILNYNKPQATDISFKGKQGQKFFNHDFSKILLYMILLVLNCFLIIILQALTTFAMILLAFNVDKNH